MGKHVAQKDDFKDPANTGPLRARRRAALAATGALMVVTPSVASGSAEARSDSVEVTLDSKEFDVVGPIDITSMARVDFPRVDVRTTPAPPPPPAPVPVPPVAAVAAPPAVVPVPKKIASPPARPRPVATVAPAPAPVRPAVPAVPPPTVAPGKAAGIIAAAWAQIGRYQDCTMLATNSLAAVGIHFHGWPAGYLGLGHIVPASQAVPGDLIYYANGGMGLAHIAVYAGQGLAIHGGWNGNQTVSFSAYVGSGPVFIRVH